MRYPTDNFKEDWNTTAGLDFGDTTSYGRHLPFLKIGILSIVRGSMDFEMARMTKSNQVVRMKIVMIFILMMHRELIYPTLFSLNFVNSFSTKFTKFFSSVSIKIITTFPIGIIISFLIGFKEGFKGIFSSFWRNCLTFIGTIFICPTRSYFISFRKKLFSTIETIEYKLTSFSFYKVILTHCLFISNIDTHNNIISRSTKGVNI